MIRTFVKNNYLIAVQHTIFKGLASYLRDMNRIIVKLLILNILPYHVLRVKSLPTG